MNVLLFHPGHQPVIRYLLACRDAWSGLPLVAQRVASAVARSRSRHQATGQVRLRHYDQGHASQPPSSYVQHRENTSAIFAQRQSRGRLNAASVIARRRQQLQQDQQPGSQSKTRSERNERRKGHRKRTTLLTPNQRGLQSLLRRAWVQPTSTNPPATAASATKTPLRPRVL